MCILLAPQLAPAPTATLDFAVALPLILAAPLILALPLSLRSTRDEISSIRQQRDPIEHIRWAAASLV